MSAKKANELEKIGADDLERTLLDHLKLSLGEDRHSITKRDIFLALSNSIRDLLMERWLNTQHTYRENKAKRVYYLSMEFLIGRLLGDSILSLDLFKEAGDVTKRFGFELDDVLEEEADAGLGNGGLGRLAACFLDSLATLQLPAFGYGIRYEFGLFRQKIKDGFQIEEPDNWLAKGDPWEVPRSKIHMRVNFYGRCERYLDDNGHERTRGVDAQEIRTMPYDILVPGFRNGTVNTLRLWAAHASENFDLQYFNDGNYEKAWERIVVAENISKVLYPRDDTEQGKELRLKQEYFFTSASVQDILRRHLKEHPSLDNLPDHTAIQLNDTHPAIGIPELMRLLIDDHGFSWEKAWKITTSTFAYTNHTLMSEALEKWSVELLGRLLPRHLEIIYLINDQFLKKLQKAYPGDMDRIRRTSIIEEDHGRNVRMAHLAIIGSSAVNGVARIHSNLLKTHTFKDFHEMMPSHFTSKTNGITQRRWLLKSNPSLSKLITDRIGNSWIDDLYCLRDLLPLANDEEFQEQWREVKRSNKATLANLISKQFNTTLSTDSMFDCQVKRMHLYKRQHLNILRVITHYLDLKNKRIDNPVPRTVVFAGKAAPGYFMAKLVIKLINAVGKVVNNDPQTKDLLNVFFLENYNVSLAEKIFSGSDLSEQISTAGTEASGTGNMKFCLNGALTIGTMDGANIEICEEVGPENIFIFGMNAEQVEALKCQQYNPEDYAQKGSLVREALDMISNGAFSEGDRELFAPIVDEYLKYDGYYSLADFEDYRQCQHRVDADFRNTKLWTAKSIINVANSGKFSSDRTIRDYAQEIWHVKPIAPTDHYPS